MKWLLLLMALGSASVVAAQEPAASTAEAEADGDSLADAYRREFAFLAGLKRQLAERLETVEVSNRTQQADLAAEIEVLEDRLLAVEERAGTLREQVTVASQTSPTEERDLVEATLSQAEMTLSDYDREIEGVEGEAQRAERIIRASTDLLAELNRVTREEGEFFNKEGVQTRGTIVKIGRIAAFGASDDAAGALAPAGEGRLKIWRDSGETEARELAAGGQPASVSFFFVESMSGQVDDSKEQSLFEHVDSGGWIAWVIMALGAIGLALAVVRAVLLALVSRNLKGLEERVAALVAEGQYPEAIELSKASSGSAARVMASLLPALQQGMDDVEDVVSEAILAENRRIQRFSMIILVVAAVAPLLGLLGTVTGMISTFDVITKFGTGDPKMLSGGISTALVTTELGLVVAIPTLLLGNLLRGWADNIESAVEHAVFRIVNVHRDRGTPNPTDILPQAAK